MPDTAVGRTARALGFLGIAPQAGAVAWVALGQTGAAAIAAFYPLLILSFLGGAWWGLAMRAEGRQGAWVTVAVLPSLIAFALGTIVVISGGSPWSLVAIGVAVLLTLPVDRALVTSGTAPAGWMSLRVPLSLALGGLTILCGVLVSQA